MLEIEKNPDLVISDHSIEVIISILDKLDPVLMFSDDEKDLIIQKINQLDSIFHTPRKPFMRTINKVFTAILFLQVNNSEMRRSRHLNLYALDKIFDHCGVKTYNLKILKKFLRSINFDWSDLRYSYEEGYAYYGSLLLNDDDLRKRVTDCGINPDVYTQTIHDMFTLLLSSTSWLQRSKMNASLIQFVLKSIQTFSEIIDKQLASSDLFSSVGINRYDIISIIDSKLSHLPNITQVSLGRIHVIEKSASLCKYIYSMEDEFIQLVQDKMIQHE